MKKIISLTLVLLMSAVLVLGVIPSFKVTSTVAEVSYNAKTYYYDRMTEQHQRCRASLQKDRG